MKFFNEIDPPAPPEAKAALPEGHPLPIYNKKEESDCLKEEKKDGKTLSEDVISRDIRIMKEAILGGYVPTLVDLEYLKACMASKSAIKEDLYGKT